MTQMMAIGSAPQAAADIGVEASDRRRPGRTAASPHLLPLLRAGADEAFDEGWALDGAAADIGLPGGDDDAGDRTALARGIVLGLAISVPAWAAIAAFCWVVL